MIAIYARVSTQEQALNGHSIDEQIERMHKYCDAFSWMSVKDYVDAGFSGAKTDRPALQNLLKDVKAKKIDKVLVYKLDRLSRSQKDTLWLIEDVFLANKCDFVSISENFDTGTPLGKAMIGILAVFAQLEREQIKERMVMGKEARAKKGLFQGGGFAPTGYDFIDGELVINEYEAMQIREAHKLYQSGMSSSKIAKEFFNRGYSHKCGKWYQKRVLDCLLNDIYLGYVHFQGKTYKGTHEPIIDQETFDRTLAIYNQRKQREIYNHGKTALSGLIYCAHCGAKFSAYGRNDYKGHPYRYYACHSRRKTNWEMVKDINCKNKIYTQQELDGMVFDAIKSLASDPTHIHEMIETNKSDYEQEKLLKKEIQKLSSQKSRFMDLYGLGTFSAEEIQAKIVPINEQMQRLEKELDKIQTDALSEKEAVKLVQSFEDILETGDRNQIHMLLVSLIDRIVINGDDVEIHWRFT